MLLDDAATHRQADDPGQDQGQALLGGCHEHPGNRVAASRCHGKALHINACNAEALAGLKRLERNEPPQEKGIGGFRLFRR